MVSGDQASGPDPENRLPPINGVTPRRFRRAATPPPCAASVRPSRRHPLLDALGRLRREPLAPNRYAACSTVGASPTCRCSSPGAAMPSPSSAKSTVMRTSAEDHRPNPPDAWAGNPGGPVWDRQARSCPGERSIDTYLSQRLPACSSSRPLSGTCGICASNIRPPPLFLRGIPHMPGSWSSGARGPEEPPTSPDRRQLWSRPSAVKSWAARRRSQMEPVRARTAQGMLGSTAHGAFPSLTGFRDRYMGIGEADATR